MARLHADVAVRSEQLAAHRRADEQALRSFDANRTA
jgi:hypothetical protein